MPEPFAAPPGSPSLLDLVTRLRADQRQHWQRGERIKAEAYREREPALRADREAFLDLIFSEFLLREELRERPTLEEYIRRFPQLERDLRVQMEVHLALGPAPTGSVGSGLPSWLLSGAADAGPPEPQPTVITCPRPSCGPAARPDDAAIIRRYRLREEIGAGAFGTVYRAHDPQLDRDVALKLLKPSALATVGAIDRFQREAKAAARMLHPNIVPVHDAGPHGSQFYIASAFIVGRSLADLIPRGGMEPGRAVRLVLQLLDALAYAHEHNVLHRDVKPGNILVTDRDHLYLTDFGLAGWVEPEQTRMTQLGTVIGTPAYMAPEQAAGDTRNVGPAADVYSAGVVLYQLLTGRVPFDGPIDLVLANVLSREPAPASSLRPGLDPKLEAICAKAMAKRRADRYADATAFAAALRRWQGAKASPVAAPTVLSAPPPSPWGETSVGTPTIVHQTRSAPAADVPRVERAPVGALVRANTAAVAKTAAPERRAVPAGSRRASYSVGTWWPAAVGCVALLVLASEIAYLAVHRRVLQSVTEEWQPTPSPLLPKKDEEEERLRIQLKELREVRLPAGERERIRIRVHGVPVRTAFLTRFDNLPLGVTANCVAVYAGAGAVWDLEAAPDAAAQECAVTVVATCGRAEAKDTFQLVVTRPADKPVPLADPGAREARANPEPEEKVGEKPKAVVPAQLPPPPVPRKPEDKPRFEDKAAVKLKFARDLHRESYAERTKSFEVAERTLKLARRLYDEVREEFPGTKAAAEAEDLLAGRQRP